MTRQLFTSTVAAFSLFISAASFASPVGNYDGAINLSATTNSSTTHVQAQTSTNDTMGNYGGAISVNVPKKNTEPSVAVKASNNDPMGNYGYGR